MGLKARKDRAVWGTPNLVDIVLEDIALAITRSLQFSRCLHCCAVYSGTGSYRLVLHHLKKSAAFARRTPSLAFEQMNFYVEASGGEAITTWGGTG